VAVLDRISKQIVFGSLSEGQSLKILPGIFHITAVFNKGAAFGLFKDQKIFFIALSMSAIASIIIYLWRRKADDMAVATALGLVLGGAAGNLADRLRFGYVVDFLDFRVWPVFNLADSAITIGAVILVWRVMTRARRHKSGN
jgi:signal peptidase II